MSFEHYIYTGSKRLRCGYTTGSCAALAAKAAAEMLLGESEVTQSSIITPAGLRVLADVLCAQRERDVAGCAVKKDAGDDVDVTDGLLIHARVSRADGPGIRMEGGTGVGRVTKPGLEQPVGEAAINSTPRRMIREAVQSVCLEYGYRGGLHVIISVPEGEAAAGRTFNRNLGIEGGISILGTTGIVEPKSLSALRDSIALEIRQRAALGERGLILTPGNYGRDFTASHPRLDQRSPVSCSNFIGDALDFAAQHEFRQVLLVGHIGKLVKLAGGIMDTHSRTGDCRCELFCAHAAVQGASRETARALLDAVTADACIDILGEANLLGPVLQSLAQAVNLQLERRAAGAYAVGALVFSAKHGLLFGTPGAEKIIHAMEEEE